VGAHPPADVPAGPPFFQLADEAAFTELVEGSGFSDVDVRTVEFGLHVDDGAELWDGLVKGSVRVGPMILGQTEDLQREIRERYDELLEEYRTRDGYDVPVSVKIASGQRAA